MIPALAALAVMLDRRRDQEPAHVPCHACQRPVGRAEAQTVMDEPHCDACARQWQRYFRTGWRNVRRESR